MRLPSLSAGFLVFLLTSILFVSGEARLGPGSRQGADGSAMQRRRMLAEVEHEQQQLRTSEEGKKQDEQVNDSPVEQHTKQEEQPGIEEKKEQPEITAAEKKPEEQKKEEKKLDEKDGKKTLEETNVETKVEDQEKEDQKPEEKKEESKPEKIEEAKSEETPEVQVEEVKQEEIESSDDGSKREEQLLEEALVLESEEKRVHEEMKVHSKPDGGHKQEVEAQEKETLSVSSESKTTGEGKEPLQQQEQGQPQLDAGKEVTHVNEKKEDSKPDEKKDDKLMEESKIEDRKELPQQDEKKAAVKSDPKGKEKTAEKKAEEVKQSSTTEQKVDQQVEEKKSDPVAQETVKGTSGSKKDELEVEQQEEQKYETEDKETKQDDKLEESTSVDLTDSSEPDDDYPDFLDEFFRLPLRLQESAENLRTNVPGWEKISTNSKDLFNQANEQIKESFTPLIGREYAPVVAYLVSYGLLLLPLGIVMFLFERVRAIFSLQKVLLFINIYVAAYFAALVAAAFILGSEPMDFFRNFSPSSYIFLQLLQAFGYIMFIILQTFDLLTTCSSGRIAAKLSATLQWLVVVAVGFHYYVTVFHRAMAKSKPLTSWKVYGLYSIAFTILCAFARIERGKKQYIQEGGEGSTKQS